MIHIVLNAAQIIFVSSFVEDNIGRLLCDPLYLLLLLLLSGCKLFELQLNIFLTAARGDGRCGPRCPGSTAILMRTFIYTITSFLEHVLLLQLLVLSVLLRMFLLLLFTAKALASIVAIITKTAPTVLI